MNFKPILLSLLFSWISLVGVGAQSYQLIADYTGQTDLKTAQITEVAKAIQDSLPKELQSSFCVFDYYAYVYTASMYGAEMAKAEEEAMAAVESAGKQFYIVFIHVSSPNNFNHDTKVKMNLPNTGKFSCFTDDVQRMIEGFMRGKEGSGAGWDQNSLSMVTGLQTGLKHITAKLKCCECNEFSSDEIGAALENLGYYKLEGTVVGHALGNPGGTVVGNMSKLHFETTELGFDILKNLKEFTGYARIREVNQSTLPTILLKKPDGSNWQDIVFINLGGEKTIYFNFSYDLSNLHNTKTESPTLIYHFLVGLMYAGISAAADFAAQYAVHMLLTWTYNFAEAWDSFEVDGVSVIAAGVSGAANYLISLFPTTWGRITTVAQGTIGQVAVGAFSSFTAYIISNPQPFSLSVCAIKMLEGVTASIIGAVLSSKFVNSAASKFANTISTKGQPYLTALAARPGGAKLIEVFSTNSIVKEAIAKLVKVFKVGDIIKGISVKQIKKGTSGKIAIIGRSMGNDKVTGIRHVYEELKNIQKVEAEIFDAISLTGTWKTKFDEATAEFKELTKDWTIRLSNQEITRTKMFKLNKEWAQDIVKKGYTILDMGDFNNLGFSGFYSMEKMAIFK